MSDVAKTFLANTSFAVSVENTLSIRAFNWGVRCSGDVMCGINEEE